MPNARPILSMKPSKVAELSALEVVIHDNQVLIWTIFDEETNLIMKAFDEPPYTVRPLTGKTRDDDRENILADFKSGDIDVLVSNARMLGFGQNLQMAGAMIISGWNDSFEQLYQLIRRSVRYGQLKSVRIHIPMIPEFEQAQWDNLQRKQTNFDVEAALQERYYREAMGA